MNQRVGVQALNRAGVEDRIFRRAAAGFRRRQIHMLCCYKGVVYDMR